MNQLNLHSSIMCKCTSAACEWLETSALEEVSANVFHQLLSSCGGTENADALHPARHRQNRNLL